MHRHTNTSLPSTVPQVQDQVAKETNMRVLNIHCITDGRMNRQTDK